MEPNQDQNTTPDYSFLSQDEQQKGGLLQKLSGGSNNNKTRLLVVVSIGGVVLVLLALLIALVFGGGADLKQNMIAIAQRQQEIIRISDEGRNNARNQEARTIASTTKASISSSQQRVVSNVSSKGQQLRQADLNLRTNPQTTSDLEQAQQANRFDEVFLEILRRDLVDYLSVIDIAAGQARGADSDLLQQLGQEAQLLINAIDNLNW